MNSQLLELANEISNSNFELGFYLEKFYIDKIKDLRKSITIEDCFEELVDIDPSIFPRFNPHLYSAYGAIYPTISPFHIRQGVYKRLLKAKEYLSKINPNYQLKIFDAYRPLAVQQYMVEYTFNELVKNDNLQISELTQEEVKDYYNKVFLIWATPDKSQLSPPPHSTGSAIDLTIVDENGIALDMGTEIDAMPPESLPNYFYQASTEREKTIHQNRELLNEVMSKAGFSRLIYEWWHFSYGDQFWAMMQSLKDKKEHIAIYGRVE